MRTKTSLKITSLEDERFIDRIIGLLESKIKDENFNIIELSERAGISRPHLYRRIHNLFGKSPNHLISEMRLREAVKLIHKKFGNISEIAYEVGYNNPRMLQRFSKEIWYSAFLVQHANIFVLLFDGGKLNDQFLLFKEKPLAAFVLVSINL